MKIKSLISVVSILAVFFACAVPLAGQEFRGQIAGRILDPSSAIIPGAKITITNLATGAAANMAAGDTGSYAFLYLTPGKYTITVQAVGFKKLVREGVEVRVDDVLKVDFKMELGGINEVVNVTAAAPLLETESSSVGQIIDQRRIADLPLSDGNPFTLNRLAAGVTFFGDLKFSRPFDNNGTSDIAVDGAPRGNEFTLDGSPNNDRRRVAFVPPSDAVQEFKVETASYNAADGHTASGNVNVLLKSGTNQLHGTAYEFVRNDKLSANDFFLNRAGKPRAPLRYNRYGGTIGGPIWLPKIYNGRNRTFFFFAYEGIKDQFPEPGLYTVPTDAERTGDLSALLALGTQYQIYDPFTAIKLANGRIQRQTIAGNIILPGRISPIAQKYLSYYPKANTTGDKEGRNNFIGPNGRGDNFHSETYRFDQQFNDKHRVFFRFSHNSRLENRSNWSGVTNGIHATGNFLYRINNGGTWDHIWTLSPTTLLNYRVGYSRFLENNVRQHEGNFDPASLGFSKETTAFFGDNKYFPRFEIGQMSVLGDSKGDLRTHNIYSFQPTLTRIFGGGKFFWRFGYDFRTTRDNSYGSGHYAGRYDFGTTYTRGPLDNSTSAPMGQDLAAFLLGVTTGGLMDRNASSAYQTQYHAVFAQLDWKISPKLTANLGLRYDYETGMTERYNRNIRGFDETSPSPIEAQAKAAYALKPIPELPVDQFKVRGGYLFLTDQNRGIWNPDKNNFQPRIGLAWQIGKSSVIRGGWGFYSVPFIYDGNRQDGFSQSTSIVPSLDTGLTFIANLANAFPSGVTTPPGASLGLATFLGRSLNFVPLDRKNSQSQRWSINFQRELPGGIVVEASYVGSKGYDLSVDTDIYNAVPKKYLSTSSERDQTTIDSLTTNVANPFAGLIPGQSLNSANVQRQNLLRPFPEFGTITSRRNDGSTIYHSAQFRAEKRFNRGYTLLVNYTFSRLRQKTTFLNSVDTEFEDRLSDDDRPHRITASGILEFPFGHGKRWGAKWNRFVNAIFGGWQGTGMMSYQSGQMLNFDSNYLFRGDPNTVALPSDVRTIDRWFDTSGFETSSTKQLANNYRTAPRQFPGVRAQPVNLADLSILKNFAIREGVRFQLRGEFLNAFNHAQFESPERSPTNSAFGKITGQTNLARNIQIGLKLIF